MVFSSKLLVPFRASSIGRLEYEYGAFILRVPKQESMSSNNKGQDTWGLQNAKHHSHVPSVSSPFGQSHRPTIRSNLPAGRLLRAIRLKNHGNNFSIVVLYIAGQASMEVMPRCSVQRLARCSDALSRSKLYTLSPEPT